MNTALRVKKLATIPVTRYSIQDCISRYGHTRSYIHGIMLNDFDIPEKLRPAMAEYQILYYTGIEFNLRLKDGCITAFGHSYHVVYKNTTPVICKNTRGLDVRLSFRRAINKIGLPAYVLVTTPYN